MENAQPIQVISNAPKELIVRINRGRVPILGVSKATSNDSAVFLFVPFVTREEDQDRDLRVWLRDTTKLIAAFRKYPGKSIMLCVPDLLLSTLNLAKHINDELSLTQKISDFQVTQECPNPLWSLIYDANIRSSVEYFEVFEEALAMCLPLGYIDQISQTLADEGAKYLLGRIASMPSEKALKQQNELLLIQLREAQEELEQYFLSSNGLQGGESAPKTASKIEVLPMIKLLPRRAIRSYIRCLFDKEFYRGQGGSPVFPVFHYELMGWMRAFEPHPLFDTNYYLEQVNHTLDSVDMPPLLHYLRCGSRLHVSPHRDFDADFYHVQNPDVAESGIPLLAHFVLHGWQEGRNPNPVFDCNAYLATYKDVAQTGMNPLTHYVLYGRAEGRRPNPVV